MINAKTKLLIINSPHNPTGKVFNKSELEAIAAVVRKHPQLCVISDEVYEFLTFDDAIHIKYVICVGLRGFCAFYCVCCVCVISDEVYVGFACFIVYCILVCLRVKILFGADLSCGPKAPPAVCDIRLGVRVS
jgi:hypothetical protein